MTLGQRRHLDGIVDDEGGLDVCAFTLLAEDLVDELTLAHRGVGLDAGLTAEGAQFFFALAGDVEAGLLQNCIGHGDATIGSLEVNLVVADLNLGGAVDIHADLLEHGLGELHHPVIVLISHIYLHAGELRIVGAVHTFVAEVARELIYTLETADDQTLEIELIGDTKIEGDVERIMVCDEGTCRGAAGDGLKHRSLHFEVTMLIEILAHRVEHLVALYEDVAHTGIHHQVDITLTIAELGVGKCVVGLAIFELNDREGTEALGEDGNLPGVDGDLSHLGAEHEALHADEVAYVEEFLEYDIIELLIFAGTDVIARYIYLDTTIGILELHEGGFAHDASAHDASCHRHFA